jgi:hypothetical protein
MRGFMSAPALSGGKRQQLAKVGRRTRREVREHSLTRFLGHRRDLHAAR